jgi:hypothetical protein
MTSENHPKTHEMQIAEDLDTFLTAQLAGESVSAPPSLSQSETDLAAMLVAVSDEVQPDSAFAAELETRLLLACDGIKMLRYDRSSGNPGTFYFKLLQPINSLEMN